MACKPSDLHYVEQQLVEYSVNRHGGAEWENSRTVATQMRYYSCHGCMSEFKSWPVAAKHVGAA